MNTAATPSAGHPAPPAGRSALPAHATPPAGRAARLRANPVLIKELRQGVRSRVYTVVFIAIQVMMLLYLLLITANRNGGDSEFFEYMFWWLIGLFLLVCLPLTGANALNAENRGSRLDLLLLSGLSARRIVYGKWLAIAAQGVLLVAGLLPYLILRYYIDSSEFYESLVYILLMLAGSVVLTGVTVSLSVIRTALLRWFLMVFGGMFVLPTLVNGLVFAFDSIDDLYASLPVLLVSGLLLVSLCIEFAATRFNPIEENHDTPKRLILWGLLLTAVVGYFQVPDFEIVYIIMLCALAVVAWDGLCRPPSISPTLYEPFLRLGRFGRIAGWLFYPGWPAAIRFSLLTLVLAAIVPLAHDFKGFDSDFWQAVWFLFLFVGVYALPFLIAISTSFGRRHTGLTMFLIQLVLVLVTVLLHLVDRAAELQTALIVCWIPTSALLLEMMADIITLNSYFSHSQIQQETLFALHDLALLACPLVTALSLTLICFKAQLMRPAARMAQQQAQDNLRTRKAAARAAGQTLCS